MRQREEGDLTPIEASDIPLEIQPLTDATNQVMQRLQHVLDHQKRFVRDAAHQLRTPLAVLKVQVQSALRGDMPASVALQEIQETVDRATALANQMLSLAKVEQLRQLQDFETLDWAEIVREVALDVSPLIAEKDLNFEITTLPCRVQAHDWMLRELTRNLLHNAIHHTPPHGNLSVSIQPQGDIALLTIRDTGTGIDEGMRQRLFQPFATGDTKSGSGLGLMIAREITLALGGTIQLGNRMRGEVVIGLDACIFIPLINTEH
jgi:two-component system sensor histidine kinase TctE